MLIDVMKLRRNLHVLVKEARELNNKETRTAEEDKKLNSLMDTIDEKKTEIDQEERKQQLEMSDKMPEGSYWGNPDSQTRRNVQNPRSFRSLFYRDEGRTLEKGGFENVGEFLQVLHSERYDPRLAELRFQVEGVGALGGFSVPEEFGAWLMDSSIEDEVVRPRATVYPMDVSNVKHIPAWDSLDKSNGNLYGGMTAQWVAELEVIDQQAAQMRSMTLTAKKLAIIADVSNELLFDSADFEANLGKAIVNTIGYKLDEAFLTGNGAGQPLGVLNNPALITVNRSGFPSAAPGDNYVDLVNMYNRLHKSGPGRANWYVHPDVAPELMTLTDANGNLIWQANARESVPGSLFGIPIVYTEKLPGPNDPGCILLANMFHYMVGLRREITLDKSNAPGWTRDYSSFRCILRADGQGSWNQPMTRPDGSEVSWSVALE